MVQREGAREAEELVDFLERIVLRGGGAKPSPNRTRLAF